MRWHRLVYFHREQTKSSLWLGLAAAEAVIEKRVEAIEVGDLPKKRRKAPSFSYGDIRRNPCVR
jgi:hypothetical protein